MSPRSFVILLIVTAIALVAAIALAVRPNISSATRTAAAEPVFSALSQRRGDVAKVEVQTPRYTTTFEYRDGTWVDAQQGDYPAQDNAVADVVNSLTAMTTVEAKTADPEWYQYVMVGDPATTPPTANAHVIVSTANGEVLADAIIGNQSVSMSAAQGQGGTFVRRAGEDQSWLVDGVVAIPPGLNNWFAPIVNVPGPDVTSIAILNGDRTVFEVRKTDPSTGLYELVALDDSQGPSASVANLDPIRDLASGIVNVTFEGARPLDSVDLATAARTVRFTTAAGLQLDVTVVEADGETWAVFKASAAEGSAAADQAAQITAATEHWAFRLEPTRVARLGHAVSELIQPPATDAGQGAPAGAAAPFTLPEGIKLPDGLSVEDFVQTPPAAAPANP